MLPATAFLHKSNMSTTRSYKEIYDLLEQLCNNLAGPDYRDALKHVSQYISNNPTSLRAALPYDETTLVSKISNHLSVSSTGSAQNDIALFLNLHEQLKACQLELRQKNAVLTFLLLMANPCKSVPLTNNSNGYDSTTTASSKAISRHVPFGSVISSFRTEIFSAGTARPTDSTIEKLFPYHGKKPNNFACPSSSESNLKVAPIRKPGGVPLQSDSSDSSPRDCKDKILGASSDLTDELVQDVIYAFTGIQGKYLKKDLISGGFKLDPKSRNLNVIQAGMLLRLSELGYFHDQVQSFTDSKSGRCALGLMGQGFVSALKNELTKYYGLVAMLQEQLNRQRKQDYSEWSNVRSEKMSLMKVMVWAVDPLHRLQWLATIAEACQERKGGALASIVYEYLSNGDPIVKSLVMDLLIAICGPLQLMLARWLLEGEIVDPHGEFFIECLHEVGPDRLWHDKYRVRSAMLPSFISTELANKILVTGKSINFLREVCEDKTPIKGREELKQLFESNAESIFANVADTKLHAMIDNVYLSTSKKVLDIVMGPHKLLEHLQAMRRYLLLGQGDFIGILMENLKPELDRPGKELYCYDLSSILDAAIRSTNAQFDDPEILNHLDVRLLNPFDGDTGWDIISLQYTVRGPLSTMLEPSMHNYQILFKPLWRMKHMEFLLSSKIWRDQMCNVKLLRSMSRELNTVLYRLHLYTSEMIHFVHQMQYYILFEVIECSWASFLEKVHQAKALDDILTAHNEFLETIKTGAFLDVESDSLGAMEEIYLGIMRLEVWQDKFFEACFKELDARKTMDANVQASEEKGEYGVTAEKIFERDEEQKIFEQYLADCVKSLEKISTDYELAMRRFLLALNSNNDHNLQLFGIRLDFNEYYKKRDQRLGVPLTFEHMRMSNTFFNNKGSAMNFSRNSTN